MLPLLVACAMTPVQTPELLRDVRRIVMLGDSITEGGSHPKGYVTLVVKTLEARLPHQRIEVLNAGVSGHKATDMAARFPRDVLDKKPDLVTISVGVNDVWHDFRTPDWSQRLPNGGSGRGVPLKQFEQHVEAMIVSAKRGGVRVVLLSPTLVYEDLACAENQRLAQYVRAGERLARKHAIPFVNLNRAFRDAVAAYQKHAGQASLLLTTDGVHLNDAGNALMAGVILRSLGVAPLDVVAPD